MTPQVFNTEFCQGHSDNVFLVLTSTNEELKDHFDRYIHDEYDDLSERLSYLEIAEVARFLVDRLKAGQTSFFQDFFTQVEVILSKCDSYVNDLLVFGLFESIQNGWDQEINYYQDFDKWLKPISKQKWDGLIDFWEGNDWREKSTGL